MLKHQYLTDLPKQPNKKVTYHLLPKNPDPEYYRERVDRNIGWITEEEQYEIIRKSTVGIAGCGGMGGVVGQILARLGVGTIKIADIENFDVSNINRQFGATRASVGKSKAFVTAKKIRETTDDTTLIVFPQGICEETAGQFIERCDVICDEIEFWAVGARILLHKEARAQKVPLLNCDTVGHRTYIFRFTHESMYVEEALGFSYEEGKEMQKRIQAKQSSNAEIQRVIEAVLRTFVPEVPEYMKDHKPGTREQLYARLFNEGRASIIASNPPMASGFLANRILLELLKKSPIARIFREIPLMPGFLGFDAATVEPMYQNTQWW